MGDTTRAKPSCWTVCVCRHCKRVYRCQNQFTEHKRQERAASLRKLRFERRDELWNRARSIEFNSSLSEADVDVDRGNSLRENVPHISPDNEQNDIVGLFEALTTNGCESEAQPNEEGTVRGRISGCAPKAAAFNEVVGKVGEDFAGHNLALGSIVESNSANLKRASSVPPTRGEREQEFSSWNIFSSGFGVEDRGLKLSDFVMLI